MELSRFDPCVRFACILSALPAGDFHCAYDCRLFLVLEGRAVITVEDTDYVLTENDCLYIPPAVPYRFGEWSEGELRVININADLVQPDRTHPMARHPDPVGRFDETALFGRIPPAPLDIPHRVTDFGAAIPLLTALCTEFRHRAEGYRVAADSLLRAVAVLLCRRLDGGAAALPLLVQQLSEYIRAHYMEHIDAHVLREQFHYHPYYLGEVFRRATGKTLHRYLIEERLYAARRLMTATDLTLSVIAERVGFRNSSDFSRVFRTSVGMSPSEYRERHTVYYL